MGLRARAIRRAATIMEVVSDVKIFIVGATLTDLMNRPKKKFLNLFDLGFFSNKTAAHLRDERLPYLFRKKNAIACVETAKYVVSLEKKTKKLFVERVDEMAKKMNAI